MKIFPLLFDHNGQILSKSIKSYYYDIILGSEEAGYIQIDADVGFAR